MWFILRTKGNHASSVPPLLTCRCSHGRHLSPRLGLEACLVPEMLEVLFPPWGVQGKRVQGHFLYLEVVTIKLSCSVPLFLSFPLLVTL